MSLKKANDFESQFYSWFDSGLKDILNDNRRRYRMELADKDERTLRGLSALPSTKSTSVVDIAVERALLDYHGDPEALSYTAKSVDDPMQEQFAQWLTKVFHYRAEHTFPFFTWHTSSLTAAFADGLEAALITWSTVLGILTRATCPKLISMYGILKSQRSCSPGLSWSIHHVS